MPGDDILYRRFLSGDTDAYDELMVRYGDGLTFYLFGYLHSWEDAEDLMIEAFARVMVKKPSLREGAFRAYLFKTARHLASRFHDKQRRQEAFSFDNLDEETAGSLFTEKDAFREDLHQVLHLCLERIEPELREALWLVYGEDMSYAEAARVMGVNAKRVDHLLSRGKVHMRKELEKEGITHAYE